MKKLLHIYFLIWLNKILNNNFLREDFFSLFYFFFFCVCVLLWLNNAFSFFPFLFPQSFLSPLFLMRRALLVWVSHCPGSCGRPKRWVRVYSSCTVHHMLLTQRWSLLQNETVSLFYYSSYCRYTEQFVVFIQVFPEWITCLRQYCSDPANVFLLCFLSSTL